MNTNHVCLQCRTRMLPLLVRPSNGAATAPQTSPSTVQTFLHPRRLQPLRHASTGPGSSKRPQRSAPSEELEQLFSSVVNPVRASPGRDSTSTGFSRDLYDLREVLEEADDGLIRKHTVEHPTIRKYSYGPEETAVYKAPAGAKFPRHGSGTGVIAPTYRLAEATRNKDLAAVEKIWEDIIEPTDFSGRIVHSPRAVMENAVFLLNRFITSFVALKRPERAVGAWQKLIEMGREPNIDSWNALLLGCARSQDVRSLNGVWARMITTGVTPDVRCWTTRIYGLMNRKQWEAGLRVLEEMAVIWRTAVLEQWVKDDYHFVDRESDGKSNEKPSAEPLSYFQHIFPSSTTQNADATAPNIPVGKMPPPHVIAKYGDIGNIVKPTTETLNAAISGLIKSGMSRKVQNVVSWAEGIGIHPNLTTFNTLLRDLIARNRFEDAMTVLQAMEKRGMTPDVTTFTSIIDIISRGSSEDATDTEKQHENVAKLLAEMGAHGLKANEKTFATLLRSFLKDRKNISKATDTFKQMASRNIKPSPHIYTMLAAYFLKNDPPDINALDELYDHIKRTAVPLDHIFYDRVIEGLATHGLTDKMRMYLFRMSKERIYPGWDALRQAVEVLVKKWDMETAEQLITDAEAQRNLDGGAGEKEVRFWAFAESVRSARPPGGWAAGRYAAREKFVPSPPLPPSGGAAPTPETEAAAPTKQPWEGVKVEPYLFRTLKEGRNPGWMVLRDTVTEFMKDEELETAEEIIVLAGELRSKEGEAGEMETKFWMLADALMASKPAGGWRLRWDAPERKML